MITQLLLALILGISVGGVAGYIGSLMLTKRMALIGGAFGHLTLPGITLALLYDFDVSLGALLFLAFGTLIIWLLQIKTKLPTEALTAVVFATALSTAFLFLPKDKTGQALIGDISQISPLVVGITLAASLVIFFLVRLIYKKMILISISSDLAKANRINVKLYNFIYLTCIALTIALGVRIVGGLMTAALVAIPACTSKNISSNLAQYAYTSMLAGALASAAGIIGFLATGIPAGPLIIIASATLFLVSVFVK